MMIVIVVVKKYPMHVQNSEEKRYGKNISTKNIQWENLLEILVSIQDSSKTGFEKICVLKY